MNGYLGKLLIVNLTTGHTHDEPLNMAYARDFIGNSGLAARYLYDMIDAGTDPQYVAFQMLYNEGWQRMVDRTGGRDRVLPTAADFLVLRDQELEGEMGDATVGAQARLMSQALRKLTSAISKSTVAGSIPSKPSSMITSGIGSHAAPHTSDEINVSASASGSSQATGEPRSPRGARRSGTRAASSRGRSILSSRTAMAQCTCSTVR